MSVVKFLETEPWIVRPGLERRIIACSNLMTVIVDFTDGPWDEAEPYHSHVHEQTCYIAEGEIILFCEGEPEQQLRAGDLFAIASGKKHTIRLLSPTARLIDNFNPIRQDFVR